MKRIWRIVMLALLVVGCGSAQEPTSETQKHVVKEQEVKVTPENVVLAKATVKASVELFEYIIDKGMFNPGDGYGFAARGEGIKNKKKSLADAAGLTPEQLQAHYRRTFRAYMYLEIKDVMVKSAAPKGVGAERMKNVRGNLKDSELALVEKVQGRVGARMKKVQSKMQRR